MKRTVLRAAVAVVPVLALAVPSVPAAADNHTADGVVVQAARGGAPIAGEYIVRLKPGADPHGLTKAMRVNPRYTYTAAVRGFAGPLTPGQLTALRTNPSVESIEQDAELATALDTTQLNPPSWGVDRVDQAALPLSNSYTYTSTGAGVHAYIIDTGIKTDLPEFEGRASFDFNAVDRQNTDCQGHGTHVAGTVGSKTYGIAKQVRLHAVKMMNCRGGGKTSATIKAIDWVTANAQKPAVANTSWNWDYSDTLATALRGMISSGVFLATSAGNTGANSCDRLPRAVTEATVVAASDRTDTRASFSSTGACVDLYAPGAAIVSTVITGGSEAWNGTSMATPHVAGVAALYKATHGDTDAATLGAWLTANAVPGAVSGGATGGTANLLLQSAGL